MKITINTPPEKEVLQEGQEREVKTKTIYDDGEIDNVSTELRELERAGYALEVVINAKTPKE